MRPLAAALARLRRDRRPPAERRSLTHGAGFAAVSFAATALLAIVSSVVMARLYGIRIVGEVALAAVPMGILSLISTVREQPALVRRIAPLVPREPHITGLFAVVLGFSGVLTVALALPVGVLAYVLCHGPFGQPELTAPALTYLAGYVLFANTSWNFDSIFAAFGDGRRLFWVRLNEAVVSLTLIVVLSGHHSVWSPVLAGVASWMTALVHRVITVRAWMRFRVGRADLRAGRGELPEIVRFGLKMTPGSLAAGITNESGTWILGALAPVTVVGAYSRAWTISKRFMDVNWRLSEMVFPALVERRARGDQEGFDRSYVTAVRYSTMALLGLAAVGGGAAHGIMAIFGAGFGQATTALVLTLLLPWTATIASLQGAALLAIGRPGATTWIALLRVVVTVGATVLLVDPLGVTGPALGLVAGAGVGLIAARWLLRRHLRFPIARMWPLRQRVAVVAAYPVGFLAARGADAALAQPLGLLAGLVVGTLAFSAVLLVGGGLTTDDRARIRMLIARLSAVRPARSERPAAVDAT